MSTSQLNELLVAKQDGIIDLHFAVADNIDGMIYQFKQNANGDQSISYVSEGVKQLFNFSPEEVYADFSIIFNNIFLKF